jgi:hypothetical protein
MPGTSARLSRVTVTVEAASRRRPVFLRAPADHRRELGAQRIEVSFAGDAREVIAPAALRGVDVDADFSEPAFDHETFEEARFAAKRLAVRHEHWDEPNFAGVADQLDDFGLLAEGNLAVGELNIPRGTEPGAEFAELGLDLRQGAWSGAIGVFSQVTPGAGKVALGHRADGGAAAGVVAAEVLRWRAERLGQARPRYRQRGASLRVVLPDSRHGRALLPGRLGGGGRSVGLGRRREASRAKGENHCYTEEHQDIFFHRNSGKLLDESIDGPAYSVCIGRSERYRPSRARNTPDLSATQGFWITSWVTSRPPRSSRPRFVCAGWKTPCDVVPADITTLCAFPNSIVRPLP